MFKKLIGSARDSKRRKAIEEQVETVLLSRVPFLEGADYKLISDLAEAIESVDYGKHEVIFKEGDIGDSFFLVVKGSVRVSSKGEDIADLGVGGCFGEGALLTDEVRGATITATEEATLFQLKRDSFSGLTEKYLKVRFRLKELHSQRRAEGIKNSIERNLLENAPFLAGASSDFINDLAQILIRKTYAKDEVLICEGAEGTTFFLIEEGVVGINKSGNQIAELGPGACFGEGSLLTKKPCSATVTALTETSCFIMESGPFSGILARYPVFGKKLLRVHAGRK
ncbi:MAG: cyclic nucleotide-binding domain-containing protein [Verrucomicrobiota bacterium]